MRLKEILKERGISGSELARRLNVSPAYINFACSGKVNLSVKKCEEVAEALGIPKSTASKRLKRAEEMLKHSLAGGEAQ